MAGGAGWAKFSKCSKKRRGVQIFPRRMERAGKTGGVVLSVCFVGFVHIQHFYQ